MLTIIIPTLNEEKYLPVLLGEIKKQNFSDYEIIVADAHSGDKTVEIARSYSCKVVAGGLPARGRNEGAKAAKGDLLLFLDADILSLPPNFLEDILQEFEKRKLDAASCPVCAQGNKLDELIHKSYDFWIRLTQRFSPYSTNVVMVKKEAFQKVGGFDETVKLAEDIDLIRRIAKIGKTGFLRTHSVLVSVRRFEKDGRFRALFKYFLAGIHINLFGPVRSDIFKYRFNHYKEIKKRSSRSEN